MTCDQLFLVKQSELQNKTIDGIIIKESIPTKINAHCYKIDTVWSLHSVWNYVDQAITFDDLFKVLWCTVVFFMYILRRPTSSYDSDPYINIW